MSNHVADQAGFLASLSGDDPGARAGRGARAHLRFLPGSAGRGGAPGGPPAPARCQRRGASPSRGRCRSDAAGPARRRSRAGWPGRRREQWCWPGCSSSPSVAGFGSTSTARSCRWRAGGGHRLRDGAAHEPAACGGDGSGDVGAVRLSVGFGGRAGGGRRNSLHLPGAVGGGAHLAGRLGGGAAGRRYLRSGRRPRRSSPRGRWRRTPDSTSPARSRTPTRICWSSTSAASCWRRCWQRSAARSSRARRRGRSRRRLSGGVSRGERGSSRSDFLSRS